MPGVDGANMTSPENGGSASACKRILLVTRNLPPLTGGMERLNWHLIDQLRTRFEVSVIGPDGFGALSPPAIASHEVPLRPLSRFLLRAGLRALAVARAWRPDVVMAGSGLTAPIALIAAKACGAHSVSYLHGLDISAPHPVYRLLWLPTLRRLGQVFVNSSATMELARQAGIPQRRLHIVHPGVMMPEADPMARSRFRQRLGLDKEEVLLSVGRLTARKGLLEFVSEVLPSIVRRFPGVLLVVIGSSPSDALHAQPQTPEAILRAADAAGVARHVRFLGKVREDELKDAYWGSDVHVFPVRSTTEDPEGFGMVAVEAAAHGLATVAYASGGVSDAVGDGESGRLIPPGHAPQFADVVCTLLAEPLDPMRVRAFAACFEWTNFGNGVARHLNELLDVPR